MAKGIKITDRDRGWDLMMKRAKTKPTIRLGIRGDKDKRTKGNITNYGLGMVHEFGATINRNDVIIRIPERAHFRPAIDENLKKYKKLAVRGSQLFLFHKTPLEQSYDALGLEMKANVQEKIRSNIPPPLKPATIARKGSSVALIHHSEYINSIDFAVGKR